MVGSGMYGRISLQGDFAAEIWGREMTAAVSTATGTRRLDMFLKEMLITLRTSPGRTGFASRQSLWFTGGLNTPSEMILSTVFVAFPLMFFPDLPKS